MYSPGHSLGSPMGMEAIEKMSLLACTQPLIKMQKACRTTSSKTWHLCVPICLLPTVQQSLNQPQPAYAFASSDDG